MSDPDPWPFRMPPVVVLRRVIRNCAHAPTSRRQIVSPLRAIVAQLTGLGGTIPAALCEWAGMDPEALLARRK